MKVIAANALLGQPLHIDDDLFDINDNLGL